MVLLQVDQQVALLERGKSSSKYRDDESFQRHKATFCVFAGVESDDGIDVNIEVRLSKTKRSVNFKDGADFVGNFFRFFGSIVFDKNADHGGETSQFFVDQWQRYQPQYWRSKYRPSCQIRNATFDKYVKWIHVLEMFYLQSS